MRELFEGIHTKFLADTDLAAAVTAMYNTQAPKNAVFPYIVYSMISNTPDLDSSQIWENYLIQFNIFSDESSSGEVSDIFALLKGVTAEGTGFDYFDLLVDNYTTVAMIRESATLGRIDDVWHYTVLYGLTSTYTGALAVERYYVHLYNLLGI